MTGVLSWLGGHLLLIGSVIGLGGISAAVILWPAFGAVVFTAVKAVLAAVRRFLSALDPQGWVGLLACVVLTLALVHSSIDARHWKKQAAQNEKLYQNEVANEKKIGAQAVDLKTKFDALSSSITLKLKEQHDAENARIAADADAVRLRGPGKAACPGGSVVASAPVRHGATPPATADGGPQVPSGDRAAVSWDWLVTVTEEHDQMRNSLQAGEDQHQQLEKQWPKSEGTPK